MVAERLIAYGESQSAGRLTTYVNAIHPLYNTFDGYMIHSRGDGGSPLSQEPQAAIPTPEVALLHGFERTGNDLPDRDGRVAVGYFTARQPDSDLLRTWEVAGTAHGDYYTFVSGRTDSVGDPSFASVVEETSVGGVITCDKPMNNGPQHYVFNRAVRDLNAWVAVVLRRRHRRALNSMMTLRIMCTTHQAMRWAGFLHPYVDAPSAVLRGEINAGNSFCRLFGCDRAV
ncbi:MAG: hypothetical protein IPG64_22035 [Haliea sp.]|nr:hypothetical protein [Haliea sp.]